MTAVLHRIPEAATLLYVSRATLYRLVKDRKLRLTKVRGRSFVADREIERYLRAAERSAA